MATFTNQATLSYNGNSVLSNMTTGNLTLALTASKTATPSTYQSGDTVTYVLSLVNTESTAQTGLTVTDDLGSYTFTTLTLVPLTYVTGSLLYYVNGVLQATLTPTGTNPLTITGISVPANGTAQLVYQTTVNDYARLSTGSTITNTATVSGGTLPDTVEAEATITAEAAAQLSISKALSPETVIEGGTVTYTFTLYNYGNTAITAADTVSITDYFRPILSNLSVTFNGSAWTLGTQYTYNAGLGLLTVNNGYLTVPAATYSVNATTGATVITPGTATLVVTGTI